MSTRATAPRPEPAPSAGSTAEKPRLTLVQPKKPHICFVAPETWPLIAGWKNIPVIGGAEVQQSLIAPALAARGYKVSMVTLDHGQGDGVEVKGVKVYTMHKPDEGVPVLRYFHPRLTGLWNAMKRADADIYYHRTAAAITGFVALFCQRHGRRAIYSGASDKDFIPGTQDIAFARDRWLFDYGLKHVDRVFCQNDRQIKRLQGNYGIEGVLVPNTYSPPEDARADREGYVLWIATIRQQKRPHFALDIARRLPHRRFVIVGAPDAAPKEAAYVAEFMEQAKALPNVDYRGFVPFEQADRIFDGAALVLNTSTYEGFPNIFLQAWARGIPAVGFVDTGSRCPEGRPIYDLASDTADAAVKVERLLSDEAAWLEASARSRAHFEEKHSLHAVLDLYEKELGRLARTA